MHARNEAMFARRESRDEADAFVDMRLDAVAACLDDLARLRSHGRFGLKDQLATVRELLAGIGEAHSAHSTALLLLARAALGFAIAVATVDHGFRPEAAGEAEPGGDPEV